MYATSIQVQHGHNLPHYNPHIQILTNGHVQPSPSHLPLPNGHSHNQPPPPAQSQRSAPPPAPKEPITVVGIPSVSIQNNQLLVGSSQSSSTRSYTPLKVLGDGSFGTVWLCDWHGTLPPNTPLSPMQCGAGARPEWSGKRLVAVKRMKKKWEGGWDECQKLKELESLRAIHFHPNIIPLYDFFLLPASKELYFVFESMEGNLYHLIKARKGRALAGGLVSSIFRQIVSGLDHIHSSGYFHRDMKPENVLVTTTGLFDYTSVSPIAPPNGPTEKDVVAIIKLADFGLARETKSKPPYTEYVSTRWYRAPEVLLLSRDYSNPVDMWALGTIMAELVNLRPMFPGSDQIDQVARICEILGDPSHEPVLDAYKSPIGGGKWPKGVKMAKAVGFAFPKIEPKDMHSLFERTVPLSLVHCIRDLLKYDPDARLTSRQCLEHLYLLETTPRNNIPIPAGLRVPSSTSHQRNGVPPSGTLSSVSPRPIHPSQSNNSIPTPHLLPSQIPDASSSHRLAFYPNTVSPHPPSSNKISEYVNHPRIYQHSPHASGLLQESQRSQPALTPSVWDALSGERAPSPAPNSDHHMDVTELPEGYFINGQHMGIQGSPTVQEYPARPRIEPDPLQDPVHVINGHGTKTGKLGSLGFGKKHNKWGLGMFGGDKSQHNGLPPVDEIPVASAISTPSLKRTQSSSSDSKSLREISPIHEPPPRRVDVKKHNKKEAERVQREADKQRRVLAEKMQREQARAVMQKRQKMTQKTTDIEWIGGANEQRLDFSDTKSKQAASGPIRRDQGLNGNAAVSTTVDAAAGRFTTQVESSLGGGDWRRDSERLAKVRRREFDDDHSMSSSDVQSIGRMSSISFATVDSDPGPSRLRNRPSLFGINRMTSTSSLRTSFDDFPASARSSNSFSLEGQLAHDFRTQASVNPVTPLSGSVSPPPMQMLSLSPSVTPSSPPWMQVQQHRESPSSRQEQSPPQIRMPPSLSQHSSHIAPNGTYISPFEFGGIQSHPPSSYGHPPSPSPGHAPKSAINPIFKVPPLPPLPPSTGDRLSSPNALPPFSHLEAVAEREYPLLSPMSFNAPSEDV